MKSIITLLIIEDELAIRDMIRFALSPDEFIVLEADDIPAARRKLGEAIPDIILLDWMLPSQSGIDYIKELKIEPNYKEIPIIMLTAKAEEENKVKGLETGADDYITKPFSPAELIARIKTVLRRGPLVSPEGVIQVGKLSLNTHTHRVQVEQATIALTPNEYKLLQFFMTHPNRTYSRDQLITQVWGPSVYIDERSIDVQIRRLRARLRPHAYDKLIQTIREAGYQFATKNL